VTPDTALLNLDVVLASRDPAAAAAFAAGVSTPGSPIYHQFLPPGVYSSMFGPSTATVSRVSSALRGMGLTVGTASGSVLPVSGPAGVIASGMRTSFRQYRLASGRIARSNVAPPILPATISADVSGVVGLDNLTQFSHPLPALEPLASSMVTAGRSGPAALGSNLSGPTACSGITGGAGHGYYTAGQLATYYGLSSSYAAGTLGAGVTIALVELEPFADSDIAMYQTCYSTSTAVSRVTVDGGPGSGTGSGEAALDIEDVIGLAPAGAVHVYQGVNAVVATDADVLDIYRAIATDDTAQVVSTSWGLCEPNASRAFVDGENTIFTQMAAQGQSVFAASGDAGSADCDTGGSASTALRVDDPAAQPQVTGVGGTDLASTTGPESTWNDGIVGGRVNATGGGVSANWPMPTWQSALGATTGSSGVPCGAAAGSLCREVPDVSASASPNDGYPIYYAGSWLVFGGTSAAAPTWAALVALIDAGCGSQRLGNINPALYQLRAGGPGYFNDITTGNNDGAGVNSGTYPAGVGYDMASGLGTPIGGARAAGLCPAPSTDGAGAVGLDKTTVPAGTPTTLTFTYTAPAGESLTAGQLSLTVPSGWPAPSTTPGNPGFTTSSAGTLSVTGSIITITGAATTATGSMTIRYGDTTGRRTRCDHAGVPAAVGVHREGSVHRRRDRDRVVGRPADLRRSSPRRGRHGRPHPWCGCVEHVEHDHVRLHPAGWYRAAKRRLDRRGTHRVDHPADQLPDRARIRHDQHRHAVHRLRCHDYCLARLKQHQRDDHNRLRVHLRRYVPGRGGDRTGGHDRLCVRGDQPR